MKRRNVDDRSNHLTIHYSLYLLGCLSGTRNLFIAVGVLLLATASVDTVGGEDNNDNGNQDREGKDNAKPCRKKRAVTQHDTCKTPGTSNTLLILAHAPAGEDCVGLSSTFKHGASIKRIGDNWGTAVLAVALVGSGQLSSTITLNIDRVRAEHLTGLSVADGAD